MDATVNPRKVKQAAGLVRISPSLDERLTRLAKKTGRSKSYYARKAIEKYLEDMEDYLTAVASLEASSKERIPLDELRRRLKLDH
jgi:RHH-type rel operon transcriptional repressor/antitoxin RelB